jgi:hypothetical protein
MIIDWNEVAKMTPEQIENLQIEVEKEIQVMRSNKQIIKDEYNDVQRQIIVLSGKKHELKTALDKQGINIAQKVSDKEILNTKKWQKKSGY